MSRHRIDSLRCLAFSKNLVDSWLHSCGYAPVVQWIEYRFAVPAI